MVTKRFPTKHLFGYYKRVIMVFLLGSVCVYPLPPPTGSTPLSRDISNVNSRNTFVGKITKRTANTLPFVFKWINHYWILNENVFCGDRRRGEYNRLLEYYNERLDLWLLWCLRRWEMRQIAEYKIVFMKSGIETYGNL